MIATRVAACLAAGAVLTACLTGNGPPTIDGELDCVDDVAWGFTGVPAPDAAGYPSAQTALRETLAPWLQRFGGRIEVSPEGQVATVVIESREVVRASVVELRPGSWIAQSVEGCGRYQLDPDER